MNQSLPLSPPIMTPEPQSVVDALASLHSACSGWHTPDWTTTAGSVCAQVMDHNVVSWIWVGGILLGLLATLIFGALLRYSVSEAFFTWENRIIYIFGGLMSAFFTAVSAKIGTWPWDVTVDWGIASLVGALFFIGLRFLSRWRERRLIRLLTTNPEGAEHA